MKKSGRLINSLAHAEKLISPFGFLQFSSKTFFCCSLRRIAVSRMMNIILHIHFCVHDSNDTSAT